MWDLARAKEGKSARCDELEVKRTRLRDLRIKRKTDERPISCKKGEKKNGRHPDIQVGRKNRIIHEPRAAAKVDLPDRSWQGRLEPWKPIIPEGTQGRENRSNARGDGGCGKGEKGGRGGKTLSFRKTIGSSSGANGGALRTKTIQGPEGGEGG